MSTVTVINHDIHQPVNAVLLYGGLCVGKRQRSTVLTLIY
nr:hypothetical protein [Escherichia coli]